MSDKQKYGYQQNLQNLDYLYHIKDHMCKC